MSYKAIVCRISVRPHPDANALQLGLASGYQVVTGMNTKDGELGVFFPSDGQLSHEYCYHNNEYREGKGENKDPKKYGYFEANRRVRTIKLRGAKSEGYWVPLASLAWTGYDISQLQDGMTLTELNGHQICCKYYSPATQQAMNKQATSKTKKKQLRVPMFKEHHETEQLRYALKTIPDGAHVVLTEKLHGTSGRTGCVQVHWTPESWWQKLAFGAYNLCRRVLGFEAEEEIRTWQKVSGSRHVVLQNGDEGPNGYYSGKNFRRKIHDSLALKKGETLYYEIVGYDDGGTPLMSRHHVGTKNDPDVIRRHLYRLYGETVTYAYGCVPQECTIYIYRITQTNEDGYVVELPWTQIKTRCRELGLKHVPEVAEGTVMWSSDPEKTELWFYHDYLAENSSLMEYLETTTDDCSSLDTSHPMEGICVRVEHTQQQDIFKYKSFAFCHLEGIAKNSDTYIDLEEIS